MTTFLQREFPSYGARLAALAIGAVATTWAGHALAQAGTDDGGGAPPSGGQTVTVNLPSTTSTTTSTTFTGLPAPGTDVNSHLPSGSRTSTDTSRSSSGFDLNRAGGGDVSVHGSASGSFVVDGQFTPELHTVRRGDTLWDISQRYFSNAYLWPRLWGLNAQIQNPHWIYPGDRVRLREAGTSSRASFGGLTRGATLAPRTVLLREHGWLDDPKKDTWGELVGSPQERMFLTSGDVVYVQLDQDHEAKVGQELTLFHKLKSLRQSSAKGDLVSIVGVLKIDRYNSETRMARATIVEARDIIERGVKVGPVERKFDVVSPVVSAADIDAQIAAAFYPHAFFGQDQVIILDKGDKDGVKPGYRFFAIKRGDGWRSTLAEAGEELRVRPRLDSDADVDSDTIGGSGGDSRKYPDETYAELLVLRTREHTSTAIVLEAKHEIERTAKLFCRKGF